MRILINTSRKKAFVHFAQIILAVTGLRQLHHTYLDNQVHEGSHFTYHADVLINGISRSQRVFHGLVRLNTRVILRIFRLLQ